MPDKNIEPGVQVYLKNNLYNDPDVAKMLDKPVKDRTGVVICGGEEDEEWGARWVIRTEEGELSMSETDLSPIPPLTPENTPRGFQVRFFQDLYGSECSIQDSSLATDDAIWLGTDMVEDSTGGRMHLSRGQVAALLPLLLHFVDTGTLP